MSNTLNATKAGVALGGLLGLVHLGWSLLIAFGWAKPLMDWVFQLHMIQPAYKLTAFSLTSAIGLVVVTAVFGFVLGFVFARVWNSLARS